MTECSRRPLGESLTRLLRDRGKALARTEFRRGWNEPIDLRLLFTNNSAISTIFRRGARLLVIRKSDESMYIFLSCCSCYVGRIFSSHFVNNSTSRSRSARRFRFRSLFSASIRDESPPCLHPRCFSFHSIESIPLFFHDSKFVGGEKEKHPADPVDGAI